MRCQEWRRNLRPPRSKRRMTVSPCGASLGGWREDHLASLHCAVRLAGVTIARNVAVVHMTRSSARGSCSGTFVLVVVCGPNRVGGVRLYEVKDLRARSGETRSGEGEGEGETLS